MIRIKTGKKFKLVAFFMSFIILLACLLPIAMSGRADSNVTIYFDTGNCGGSFGWTKDMSEVYICLDDTLDSNGGTVSKYFTTQMTLTGYKSVYDSTNGKVFSYTLPAGKHFTLSPYSENQKGRYRTVIRDVIKAAENQLFFDTNGEYYQYEGIWTDKTFDPVTDYAGQTFKVLNMTDQNVDFQIKYYNTTNSDVAYATNTSGSTSSTAATITIPSRQVISDKLGTVFTVPTAPSGGVPWNRIEFKRVNDGTADGTVIKDWELGTEKIIGRTLRYGISLYDTVHPEYADDADYKTLSFNEADYPAISAQSGVLYLDSNYFNSSSAGDYTLTVGNTTYSFTGVLTAGNAMYVTSTAVSVAQNQVFKLRDNHFGATYNLVWQDSSKNLISLLSNDVADVSGVRTTQSTDNTMPNGQKYITVEADFFDYLYDHSSGTHDFDYHPKKIDGTSSNVASLGATAKRPYLIINDAISQSTYANSSSNYPMYLGQFWLPRMGASDYGGNFDTSEELYSSTTAANQRAAYNNNSDQYLYGSDTGYYSYFGFGDKLKNFKWSANLAYRDTKQESGTYRPYDAVVQGLVNSNLSADGHLMAKDGTNRIPYFDDDWTNGFWSGSVNTSTNDSENNHGTHNLSNFIKHYSDLDFPFFEINANNISFQNGYSANSLLSDETDNYNGKYYVFDSTKYRVYVNTSDANNVKLEKSNEGTMIFDNYGTDGANEATSKGQQIGLFPFNNSNSGTNGNGYDDKELHYGYGIKYDIDFYLPENGTVDGTPDGTAVTFTFQGDDDVWVFLDGKLLLDMGGAHKNALGEINFKNKKTWISAVGNASDSTIVTYGKNQQVVSFNTNDWASRLTTGEHKITMFYMERGMLNSNLYCMFNLPTNVTSWQLQEDTDFGNVNNGFKKSTEYVADSDIFNYKVENRGTTASGVLGSAYRYQTVEAVNRTNTDDSLSKTTALNASHTAYTQTTTNVIYTPKNRIYVNINIGWWSNDNAQYAAKFWKGEDDSTTVKADLKWDSNNSKWYIDTDGYAEYNRVQLFRHPQNNINTSWTYTDIKDIDLSKNTLQVTEDNGSSKLSYTNTTTTSTFQKITYSGYNTYNFTPGGVETLYDALMNSSSQGATIRMEDMFAKTGTATKPYTVNTGTVGSNKGIVSLQYGEMATASNQFAAKTGMRVTQLDTLSAPSNGSRDSGASTAPDPSRSVRYYYNTYVKSTANTDGLTMPKSAGVYKGSDVSAYELQHASTMYLSATGGGGTIKTANPNYASTTAINMQSEQTADGLQMTYTLADPVKPTSTNVSIRQVVINSVKVADLKLAKYMAEGNAPAGTSFTFTISFANIFGSTSGDGQFDITQVKYSLNGGAEQYFTKYNNLNNTASVTLGANDYIEIKGIPVGTKYTINEQADTTYVLDTDQTRGLEFNADGSIKTVEVTNEDDIDISVINKRKTGALRLKKTLVSQDAPGTYITSGDQVFNFKITFTPDTGVIIRNYTVKYHKVGSASSTVLQWQEGENAVIVPVKAVASGNTVNTEDVVVEGIPVNTTYVVDEVNLPAGYSSTPTVTYSDNTNKRIDSEYTGSTDDTNINKVDLVTIANTMIPIVMPSTGGTPFILLFPFGIIAIVISAGALVIYKRRLQYKTVIK